MNIQEIHAINSAKIFNKLKPEVVGSGSIVLFPGTELTKEANIGEFKPLNEKQMMEEYRLFLENLEINCEIATHNASAMQVAGDFLENKQKMIDALNSGIERYDEDKDFREYRRNNIQSL